MFKKLLLSIATSCLATTAWADIKVISISPAVGPVAAFAQAYQKNLKGASSFVPVKDCETAMNMVAKADHAVVLLPHDLISTAKRLGDKCWTKFEPKQVVLYSEAYYDFCRLPNNTKQLTDAGTKLGRASMHPVQEWNKDFNQRNNAQLTSVGLTSSRQVLSAVLSGDVDWGLIVQSLSSPAVAAGQIVCPYSTDVKDSNSFHKTYKVYKENYPLSNLMFANTKDVKVLEDIKQAANSADFQEFLRKGKTTYWTTSVTDQDINRFLQAANDLVDYETKIK